MSQGPSSGQIPLGTVGASGQAETEQPAEDSEEPEGEDVTR